MHVVHICISIAKIVNQIKNVANDIEIDIVTNKESSYLWVQIECAASRIASRTKDTNLVCFQPK